MHWLFSSILLLAYLVATPWFLYRTVRYGKRCQNPKQRIFGLVPVREANAECIWFHAVSVGEVQLLSTVVQQLAIARPDVELVISSTTKTGFDLARLKFPQHDVFYAPIDFHWAVNSVLRRIKPSLIVLSELEVWPNLIGMAQRAKIPVAVINGRLSDRSFKGYRRFAWLLRGVFKKLSLVAAQTEEYSQRFVELGADPEAVVTCGSIKFDGANFDRNRQETTRLLELADLSVDETIFLAGSTQPGEERLAASTFVKLKQHFGELRLIIVPRHIERSESIARELAGLGLSCLLRSKLDGNQKLAKDQILIVDTIGELGFWWGLAEIGFVGGSFGNRGGQNMLEPAALSVATCFGPRTRNFRQIVELLLESNGAIQLLDQSQLTEFVQRCLENPAWRKQLAENGSRTVALHQGATLLTIENLLIHVPKLQSTDRNAA